MDQEGGAVQLGRPFHVLIKPTGPICNLDCAYCFYLDKTRLYPETRDFRMSEEVLESFTRQYIAGQPPGTTEATFTWQGGEPTLAGLEFYQRAVELQARHRRPGMQIHNALQTNGTRLDDDWGRFLSEHDFLVGISIDGPKDTHDKYRRSRQGEGSFDQVMRGLDCLRRHAIEFNTLTVVHEDNGDLGEEVYGFLREEGSRYMQFLPRCVVETSSSSTVATSSHVTTSSPSSTGWGTSGHEG